MQPDLIVYYKNEDENNSYSSTLINKRQELKDIVCEDSNWPIFVHITFDPPLPSEVFECLRQFPSGVYCSSTFSESGFDKTWEIDKNIEILILGIPSYPLTKVSDIDLNADYSNLKTKSAISVENETTNSGPKEQSEFEEYNLNI